MTTTTTEASLRGQLRRLGRRGLAIGTASGLGWALVAAGVLALAGAWLDLVFELTPGLRLGVLAAGLTAGVVLWLAATRLAWRRATADALARQLDRAGGTRGEIVSGVDLLLRPRPLPPLGAGLARIAVDRAAGLAREIPGRRVVPARPVARSALAIGLFAIAVGGIWTVMPRMARAQWLRFADPYGDHPPYSPVVLRVEPGDTRVVYGQGFEVRVTAEGAPVERLDLVLVTGPKDAAEPLPMFPEGGGRWRAAVANVTEQGRYFVTGRGARSRRYKVGVITVPRLAGVRFRVTPPAYTNQSAYEGPLPKGGISGLPGTNVEVRAASNRPLAAGTLRLADARGTAEHPLTPPGRGDREVAGAFPIRASGTFAIQIRDVDGQESREPFSAPITALSDERPFVRIVEPREVSFATPDVTLPVTVSAEDDYGIARLQLFRALNGSRALPMDVPLDRRAPTRQDALVPLELANYGLKPGDEIQLYARVEDNDPAGPKGSESTIAVVRIIPREVYEQMVRTREGMDLVASRYREAGRRLEALADEAAQLQEAIDRLPADGELAQADRDQLQGLARRLREEAAAIGESARHPLPIDVDRALSKELEKLAQGLASLADEAEAAAAQSGLKGADAAAALARMRKRLGGDREQFAAEALAPIEHLAKLFPLLEDQARYVQLSERQRDLARRLESLHGRDRDDDPKLRARMRDLEAEQRGIRTDLAQLLDDIEDHARQLPDDPRLADLRTSAEEFAAVVRTSDATRDMTDAEAALAEFSGTRGHQWARDAADVLEQFLARCAGSGGLGERGLDALKFQPSLPRALGQSIAQMLAEAGLGQGSGAGNHRGMGQGSGSGFSTRQNNLRNIGLYGGMPTLMGSSRQGSGRSRTDARSGRGTGPDADQAHRSPGLVAPAGPLRASGPAGATVPVQYRRRVSEYFRRIAEETEDR